ncbi:MAG TPA: cytochrome c, partial [Flavobacteriales bacterium]|nr:cytochrome c [Flavobacteriales bacterium]
AYIVDLKTVAITTLPFAEGAEPGRVAFDASGRAHLVLRGAGSVATLDLASKALLRDAAVCELPRGIVHHQTQDALLVTCASGELLTLDPSTLAERSRLFVDRDLRDVVVDGAGDVVVSRFRSAELLKVRDGAIALRMKPLTVTHPRIDTFAIDRDGNTVELSENISKSPMQAWRMVTAPGGDPVVVHERGDDTEVVPAPGGYGGGGCEPIVECTMSRFDSQGNTQAGGAMSGVAVGVDAAYSTDGSLFAVASPSAYLTGGNTVRVYRSAVVENPQPDNDCGTLADTEMGSEGQAIALAFDTQGRLLVQSREPAQLAIYEFTEDETFGALSTTLRWLVPLADSSVRDTGHDLFHADVGMQLACMSCHGEARDDGHTWNFKGFGPRRTQSLGGGILSTAPFHWEGDLSTFGNLVSEVMVGRMGGFGVDDDQVTALADWIDRQPALRLSASNAKAVQHGKSLFESSATACTNCHSGDALTNNASVDVGTGGLFQVPSLRGLGLRAPYMHTGCASTLKERFDSACGGASHGNVSGLSPSDINDLVAYLETL